VTEHIAESVKVTGDIISLVTVLGTLAQILPAVAALLTIVWTCFRIYETKTVQGWLGKKPKE
jgi:hypothetical protein